MKKWKKKKNKNYEATKRLNFNERIKWCKRKLKKEYSDILPYKYFYLRDNLPQQKSCMTNNNL